MSGPYPWMANQWESLAGSQRCGKLGHAYLLCGREGLGKFEFANAFAQLILCEGDSGAGRACGICRSCLLYQSGNHPDLKLLQTEDDHRTIGVDQVRELIDFYALTSHYGRRKIGIVYPADDVTRNAANALLKILEEPPASALLILVAHQPGLLPPTVVSRCQRLHVALPAWPVREAWLEDCVRRDRTLPKFDELALQGAPLALLNHIKSPAANLLNELIAGMNDARKGDHDVLAAARRFGGHDARRFIDALEAVVQAIIQLRSGHAPGHLRLPRACLEELQEISNKLNCKRLFLYLDEVALARMTVLRSAGVRGSEIIENLWFAWVRTLRTESTV